MWDKTTTQREWKMKSEVERNSELLILVNNQLDAQFFLYVYFYSLHVSGSHVTVIRRIIVLTF